jgi:7-cyano-7-deazaguanine synthase
MGDRIIGAFTEQEEIDRTDIKSAVILLSGGMDSTTLLYKARDEGIHCHAIGFDYGQKHLKEVAAAQEIARRLDVGYKLINLTSLHDSFLMHAASSQTNPDIDVPHGHYADDNMKVTVVPNRNMIMLSIAASYAITIGADAVGYAAHAGDHAVYPDCRPVFIWGMSIALEHCHFSPGITLYTPFRDIGKHDIAVKGQELQVPWELTWSCYEGSDVHCGSCGTCVERKEAFHLSGIPDKTPYELIL